MPKELKTRRAALRDIVGAMAAAAALGDYEIAELLAQVKKVPDLAKLGGIKTTDNTLKALKIMLAPKAQAAQVFQSEYGRKPALKPSTDAKTGKPACSAYLGTGGSCAGLACGVLVCNGLGGLGDDLQLGGGWTAKGPAPSSEAGVYNKQYGCTEACYGKCTQVIIPPTVGFRINPQWLQSVKDDPYLKGLMREYGADTAEALEAKLKETLGGRRAGM